MVELKHNISIDNEAVANNMHRLVNQVYKLLPSREEGIDWQKPLETIIVELMGMNDLLICEDEKFFTILCKLKGLSKLTREEDFALFRRTIFECLGLMGEVKNSCLA